MGVSRATVDTYVERSGPSCTSGTRRSWPGRDGAAPARPDAVTAARPLECGRADRVHAGPRGRAVPGGWAGGDRHRRRHGASGYRGHGAVAGRCSRPSRRKALSCARPAGGPGGCGLVGPRGPGLHDSRAGRQRDGQRAVRGTVPRLPLLGHLLGGVRHRAAPAERRARGDRLPGRGYLYGGGHLHADRRPTWRSMPSPTSRTTVVAWAFPAAAPHGPRAGGEPVPRGRAWPGTGSGCATPVCCTTAFLQTMETLARGQWIADAALKARVAEEAAWLRGLVEGTGEAAAGDPARPAWQAGRPGRPGTGCTLKLNYATLAGVSHPRRAGLPAKRRARGRRQRGADHVVKHAATASAVLRLTATPAGLVVTVLDQGRGFEPATQPEGTGLKESSAAGSPNRAAQSGLTPLPAPAPTSRSPCPRERRAVSSLKQMPRVSPPSATRTPDSGVISEHFAECLDTRLALVL